MVQAVLSTEILLIIVMGQPLQDTGTLLTIATVLLLPDMEIQFTTVMAPHHQNMEIPPIIAMVLVHQDMAIRFTIATGALRPFMDTNLGMF